VFSLQLDKLYGESQAQSLDINEETPQVQIDSIALTLANRFLSDAEFRARVDVTKSTTAVQSAGEFTRHNTFSSRRATVRRWPLRLTRDYSRWSTM
jgi:hypothetical protein